MRARDDSASDQQKRNYGLDLLRALSILFVVTLHVLRHGGILEAAHGKAYVIAYLLESLSICAVDCFVLISGYRLCKTQYKSRRIVSLWVEALFYSVALTIFICILNSQLPSGQQIITAVTPIMSSEWWFFSQYFALFFFSIILNAALNSLSKRQVGAAMVAIILVFCLFPSLFHADVFKLAKGYSFAWFACVYFIGGGIRVLFDDINVSKALGLLAYLVGAAATLSAHVLLKLGILAPLLTQYKDCFLAYNSPFVLGAAIGLFWFFGNLKIQRKPLRSALRWITPSVFSIYLISDFPLIRAAFIKGAFSQYASLPIALLPLAVIATVLVIALVCVSIDAIRRLLFKVLRFDKAAIWAGDRLDRLPTKLASKTRC